MHNLPAQIVLLDRKIAYAVTDRDLSVIEISNTAGIFYDRRGNSLSHPLTELVPELIGSEAALAQILGGKLARFQLAWVNRELPDGQTVYLTMVDLPYRDHAGRIVGVIHLAQDVTEEGILGQRVTQQRNELRLVQDQLSEQNQRLASANTELRRLDELKSAFVSTAAHELRSPLTSILGYLELLLGGDTGPLSPQQTDYLYTVEGSAQRLLQITNDLLDATRIETGRVELVLRPANLVTLAEIAAEEIAPQLEAKTQRLILRAPARLPQVLCDTGRTMQIIGNLLNNANKYSPPGGTIILSLSEANTAGFLQVSVTDQGIGIAPEDQAGLFKPFSRTGSAVRMGVSGAGLGLYIARSLVDLHGGRIWFDSTPGKGTTFHITLPIASE